MKNRLYYKSSNCQNVQFSRIGLDGKDTSFLDTMKSKNKLKALSKIHILSPSTRDFITYAILHDDDDDDIRTNRITGFLNRQGRLANAVEARP